MVEGKRSEKILVLGVDGMDPRLAKKFMDEGDMPCLKEYVERGSAREDLVMLGGVPTVTPPMWTTLATGANPETHGILAFDNPDPVKLDTTIYALDSRLCKAEPIWNVFAESGKKTLVWHWPGSSWPPTSDSENLFVVDGVTPAAVCMGSANVDRETIFIADRATQKASYREEIALRGAMAAPFKAEKKDKAAMVGCVVEDLDEVLSQQDEFAPVEHVSYVMDDSDGDVEILREDHMSYLDLPIVPAQGWAFAVPAKSLEMTIQLNKGAMRRPCLLPAEADGTFKKLLVFKSKKDAEPIVALEVGVMTEPVLDESIKDGDVVPSSRAYKLLELAEDGSRARLWVRNAYDVHFNEVWHPSELQEEIVSHVGFVPPVSTATGSNPEYVKELLIPAWDIYEEWQGEALNYLIAECGIEAIFSHLHNIDLVGHEFWHYAKHRDSWGNDEAFYQWAIREMYKQTDRYLGRFLHLLDKDWSIVITSDHGLITEENDTYGLGWGGVNGTFMKDLGYTVFKKDENGNDLREIDYSKTKAVANRGYIQINLKGRNPEGIVDPADKYDLEAQIISDIYNFRSPHDGKRMISIALRVRDAAILGINAPDYYDIAYFVEEGYNIIHMDSLPTQRGYFDTSVSPIFVAAGKGFKSAFSTTRVIREVDVTPTIAALCGVRMPRECEGAPVYQILEAEL